MYYIYRITNLINGKTYIGQHKYTELNDRYMGSGKLIRLAIKKHGFENFKKEILVDEISNRDLADRLEIAYIREFKPDYNLTKGGTGGDVMSPETKRRMSEAMKMRKRGPYSEETRKKISEANKGRTVSEETRKKISEANKGKMAWNKGKLASKETKKKLSESHMGLLSPKKFSRLPFYYELILSGVSCKDFVNVLGVSRSFYYTLRRELKI
jgi:group I intron endonuclease